MTQFAFGCSRDRQDRVVLLLVAGVFLVLVARAAIQSVTIDEADSYGLFVQRPYPLHFAPSANNHVLNSALIKLTTSLWGPGELSLRLPALLGALIYLYASARLVQRLCMGDANRRLLFCVFAINPLIMDYLVAARGYALAIGFFTLAWALLAEVALSDSDPRQERERVSIPGMAGAISCCCGFGFCANFSFALAFGVTWWSAALILLYQLRRTLGSRLFLPQARVVLWLVVPAVVISFVFCGHALTHWPKGQFVYGATKAIDIFRSIANSSIYEPNPNLINPMLLRLFQRAGPVLCFIGVGLFVLRLMGTAVAMGRRRGAPPRSGAMLLLALAALLTILVVTLMHVIAFRFLGLLLPENRTALFYVPLFLIFMSADTSPALAHPGMRRVGGVLSTVWLWIVVVYFAACLRLTYFEEWQYDADARDAALALIDASRKVPVTTVDCHWRYFATTNFYRAVEHEEKLQMSERVVPLASSQPDCDAYLMYFPDDQAAIAQRHLKIIYHGTWTDVTVALSEALAQRLASAAVDRNAPGGGGIK